MARIWDLRRLIVPLTYFVQTPFQNWTRESASLIGSVMWYVDYTVPVEAVRARLTELLRAADKWDGKVVAPQVTDIKQDKVALRGLMSAANASLAWDLRCEIRERMLDWPRATYPQAMPRRRAHPLPCPRTWPAASPPAALIRRHPPTNRDGRVDFRHPILNSATSGPLPSRHPSWRPAYGGGTGGICLDPVSR